MKHFSHEHLLVLKKSEEIKTDGIGSYPCYGCDEPISGPFYSCEEECRYYLHKVCAELPIKMNHPMHPQHPLTLFNRDDCICCVLCKKKKEGFYYNCSLCSFVIDTICAVTSHIDKYHMHPLIPKKTSSSFLRNQFLPGSAESSDHDHQFNLLPSIPIEVYEKFDLKTKLLPMRKNWTSLISLIVGNDQGEENICGECEQLISDCKCRGKLHIQISNSNKLIDNEILHFSHDHMLHLLDGKLNEMVCGKVCEACAEPISNPSYGCTLCDYFLHKCCIELPKKISHPLHPEHKIKLFAQYPNTLGMFPCSCCFKKCNIFGYTCVECDFIIDLKCASLSGRIKHEAHEHALSSNIIKLLEFCSGCNSKSSVLKCETCSFSLCSPCATLPATINHRYCKCKGFGLQYCLVKDYDADYYCDLCETTLQPKCWVYHCGNCDQFAHPGCLIKNAGDLNIKFGKSYNLEEHEHVLTLTRFTHEYSNCKICVTSLNKGFAVGFECATCPYFKIHLECIESWKVLWKWNHTDLEFPCV